MNCNNLLLNDIIKNERILTKTRSKCKFTLVVLFLLIAVMGSYPMRQTGAKELLENGGSVDEKLLFTTVLIETSTVKQVKGKEEIIINAGTGFFFNYQRDKENYLFVVTNKHIVNGTKEGRMTFTLSEDGKPKIGERFTVTYSNFEKMWFGHPDEGVDVAIMPLASILKKIQKKGKNIFFIPIDQTITPDTDALGKLGAIEEIIFVGYPSGLYDTVNLTPIVRKGITATPIFLDYLGRKVFLIDASVFGGSSGSPVYIFNIGGYSGPGGGLVLGSRILFVGIVSEVFFRKEKGEFKVVPAPTGKELSVETKQMIDLGIVYKASTIIETIEAMLEKFDNQQRN